VHEYDDDEEERRGEARAAGFGRTAASTPPMGCKPLLVLVPGEGCVGRVNVPGLCVGCV